MVTYVVYCYQLPFYLICEDVAHQIQPQFCLISTQMPRNFFFVALGVHLHPLHPLATPIWSTKWMIMHRLTAEIRILVGSTLAVLLSVTELVFRDALFLCHARTPFLSTRTTIILHRTISKLR